jgi:hypothetical protein
VPLFRHHLTVALAQKFVEIFLYQTDLPLVCLAQDLEELERYLIHNLTDQYLVLLEPVFNVLIKSFNLLFGELGSSAGRNN